MKEDERALLKAALDSEGATKGLWELAQGLRIPYKRAQYIALKWADKGWYDYGVSWRVGWMTAVPKVSD